VISSSGGFGIFTEDKSAKRAPYRKGTRSSATAETARDADVRATLQPKSIN